MQSIYNMNTENPYFVVKQTYGDGTVVYAVCRGEGYLIPRRVISQHATEKQAREEAQRYYNKLVVKEERL